MGMVVLASAAEPRNSYARKGQNPDRITAVLDQPCVNPRTKQPCTTCETGLRSARVVQFCKYYHRLSSDEKTSILTISTDFGDDLGDAVLEDAAVLEDTTVLEHAAGQGSEFF